MRKAKYSIIIPTFERANLLDETIQICLKQNYEDFEIIISNNASKDATKEILNKYKSNKKIFIFETEQKMSMQDHWAFAMKKAKGEYILFLGDDDGISFNFFKIIDNVLERSKANMIKFRTFVYYHDDWEGDEASCVFMKNNATNNFYNIDNKSVIKSYCDLSNFSYFPNLLQSIFRKDLFDKASQKCKHMFVGAPDFSCPSLLLAQDNSKLCYVDAFLGFGGRSRNSNAAFYFKKKSNKKKSRHTEWADELTNQTRLPYHDPAINVPCNFVPGSFSYAKYFFPKNLKNHELDAFKLSCMIKKDIEESLLGNREKWHKEIEIENFKTYVSKNLSKRNKDYVFNMRGDWTLIGKIKLNLKKLYILINHIIFKISNFDIDRNIKNRREKSNYDTVINLKSEKIDLINFMDKFYKDYNGSKTVNKNVYIENPDLKFVEKVNFYI